MLDVTDWDIVHRIGWFKIESADKYYLSALLVIEIQNFTPPASAAPDTVRRAASGRCSPGRRASRRGRRCSSGRRCSRGSTPSRRTKSTDGRNRTQGRREGARRT